ncbi:MAG: PAAR domain-containing protein [Candidatus Zixiibacteriota bacterium]|nr:MAG: PAAR domain-containing protein [candidate division Zixibacteria bacterium]
MGKLAARLGDTTSHGGAIVAAPPTVLIGGMPAARQGDMHACPLVNPGVPPPPHVGGSALIGCPTVLICGQMALRTGDMAACSGPPDSIVAGCPTVLIGEGGGGGGGAGPAGAAASAALAGDDPDSDEDHFLDVKFTDKKGNPIRGVKYDLKRPDAKQIKGTLGGKLRKTGVPQGNYEIQLKGVAKPKVSSSKVKAEGKVELRAETFGIESGTAATVSVFMKESNSSDKLYDVIKTKVEGDKIKAEWKFEYKEGEDSPDLGRTEVSQYSLPQFYFNVDADGNSVRSDTLQMTDDLKLELTDADGNPIKDEPYEVYLASGEVRKGKLDKKGKATIKDIPAKKNRVVYPKLPDAKKIPD